MLDLRKSRVPGSCRSGAQSNLCCNQPVLHGWKGTGAGAGATAAGSTASAITTSPEAPVSAPVEVSAATAAGAADATGKSFSFVLESTATDGTGSALSTAAAAGSDSTLVGTGELFPLVFPLFAGFFLGTPACFLILSSFRIAFFSRASRWRCAWAMRTLLCAFSFSIFASSCSSISAWRAKFSHRSSDLDGPSVSILSQDFLMGSSPLPTGISAYPAAARNARAIPRRLVDSTAFGGRVAALLKPRPARSSFLAIRVK
mmetsp:Transcript_23795/g.68374  ORF Transcript_23795/g.68374 Transcript_23795/m.68374 type:complete len:259 (-) Transcript_23795:3143-3919(-)